MYNITSFPIEIQEMILYNLSGQNLVSMSKVCRLWFAICERIVKDKYSKIIPEECIQEIENFGKFDDHIWLTALNYHYLSKCVANNIFDPTRNIAVELNENQQLCYCVYDSLIFIGCDLGKIEVYNPEINAEPIATLQTMQDSPILQLDVMTNKNLLLAKTGSIYKTDLIFLSIPHFSGKPSVYKMTLLKPNIKNFSGELLCETNFSINGSILAIATTAQQVSIFQVLKRTQNTVELKYCTNYISNEAVGTISLWQDEVIILHKTGEILRWNLTTQTSFLSNRYHEIQYENPVWIFRGRIFCSTLISTQLLGYWHMDRGSEYWLVGKPACELVRCRDLGTMYSADTGIEDVLCVCLKQRILACGTRNGKILLYYLSDIFFSSDDFNINGNDSMTREFKRVPDLTIRMKERPVKNIQIHFNDYCIKIYTWSYIVSRRPGLLQCFTLKEGEWVTQSDKEYIDN